MFSAPLCLSTLSLFLQIIECTPVGHIRKNERIDASDQENGCRQTEIVILGAGVAGITAAKTLSDSGHSYFIIIEVNGEIGGRLAPITFGQNGNVDPYIVERGANWVHGTSRDDGPENPIFELAKKHNISNYVSDFESVSLFDGAGPILDNNYFEEFETAWNVVESDAGLQLSAQLEDRSMRAGLRKAGWEHRGDPLRMATEWFAMDWELASTAEETSQLFGTVNFNSTWYQYSEDNLFVLDQRGFVEFLRGEAREFLGEKLDDERLVLSHKVLNINYTDPDAKINIRASGAESQYACFEADHVINTFSLGVLQHDMNTMFIPELPSWKTTAINTMQMGIYTKIFMQFPPDKVFWDKSTEFFLYASDHRGRYPVFQSLDHADFHPGSGILFVTVVGDETLRVDQMDDDAVKSEVMDVLRQMFGPEIPEPTDFYFPRWSTTDWAYGSYSNMPPGMSLKQHQNVRANVDRVWFAGEHTSTNYFGFLHGAYFEGKKVAETLAARLDGDEEGGRDYVFYEEVKGCTEFKDYNEDNGWQYDTLAKPQTDVRGRRMKRSSLR